MKINIEKLNVILARKRLCVSALRDNGISPNTIKRIMQGYDVKPKTAGKIAEALSVDVTELLSNC